MTHRQLQEAVAIWLRQTHWLVSLEIVIPKTHGRSADVVGMMHPAKTPGRITIIEVKRTWSDLHADLAAEKMHEYARHATHFHLAIGPEIFGTTNRWARPKSDDFRLSYVFSELPKKWGVLLIRGPDDIESIRSVKKMREIEDI